MCHDGSVDMTVIGTVSMAVYFTILSQKYNDEGTKYMGSASSVV